MKKTILLVAACLCFVMAMPAASATGQIEKQPLNDIFHHLVIVPVDFQGKVFVNGRMTDVYEEYDIRQLDGRVLVPIRLMSYLASELDKNAGRWEVYWQPEKPDDVHLIREHPHKSITLTVNSNTMLVNKEPRTIDVPPQKIGDRIVLPLRSVAEALDKHIDWLDGLILMGDHYVDLQHPQTKALVDTVKKQLSDPRPTKEEWTTPLAKYENRFYYMRVQQTSYEHQLYVKQSDGQESRVPLPGTPNLHYVSVLDDSLYFATVVDGQSELYKLNLVNQTTHKVSSLGDWEPNNGWLSTVQKLGTDLYVTLHYGDLTMGSESLFKVKDGTLEQISHAKSFASIIKDNHYLYFTDFLFMSDFANNLKKTDLRTGETTLIGARNYAYGVVRTVSNENHTIGYSSIDSLYVRGNHLVTLGYNTIDLQDESAVYKLDVVNQTQVKLTPPADQFWIVDDELYYRDFASGHLMKTDLNGTEHITIVERPILGAILADNSMYYMTNANKNAYEPGVLYRYDLEKEQEMRLSDHPASSFFVGETSVYYISHSYAPGIYKIGPDDHHMHLVSEYVDTAILTNDGLVYTLRYENGVYTAK